MSQTPIKSLQQHRNESQVNFIYLTVNKMKFGKENLIFVVFKDISLDQMNQAEIDHKDCNLQLMFEINNWIK